MILDMICDVCKAEPAVGVASSPFGAISFAYGNNCLNMPAEPEMMFNYLYYDVGSCGEGLVDLSHWYTYMNGSYVSWEEYCGHERALGNPGIAEREAEEARYKEGLTSES